MANHTTESRIILHPHIRRVRILDGDILIADTRNAIELHEPGYPQRPDLQKELPRPGVDMSKLSVSPTVTHCPFKGDTTYYAQPSIADVAWNYERPVDEMQAIAGRLALDVSKVTDRPLSTRRRHAGKGSEHVHWRYAACTMLSVMLPSYT